MKRIKIEIEGMTCPNCEKYFELELKKIGAKDLKISHVDKSVIFSIGENINELFLKRAIKTVGYVPGEIFFKKIETKKVCLGDY